MDCFFDTEFLDRNGHLELVSVGIVSTSGRELYLVNREMDRTAVEADGWMRENVLAHLPDPTDPRWVTRTEMARQIEEYLAAEADDEGPARLWAWNGAHDKVVVAGLWESLLKAPKALKFTYELKQLWMHVGRPGLPEQEGTAHDALDDARHNRDRFEVLAAEAVRRGVPTH